MTKSTQTKYRESETTNYIGMVLMAFLIATLLIIAVPVAAKFMVYTHRVSDALVGKGVA